MKALGVATYRGRCSLHFWGGSLGRETDVHTESSLSLKCVPLGPYVSPPATQSLAFKCHSPCLVPPVSLEPTKRFPSTTAGDRADPVLTQHRPLIIGTEHTLREQRGLDQVTQPRGTEWKGCGA